MPQQQPLTVVKSESLSVVKSEPIGPPATPAPTESRGWLDSVKDYLGELQSLNPMNYVRAADQAVRHPVATVQAMGAAQGQLATDAEDAFKRGDYATGLRKALHYLLPVIGPMMDKGSEHFEAGEYAKGLGVTTDVALQVAGPAAAKNALASRNVRTPAIRNHNPEEAAAVELGIREGIPVDAGTATGNRFVRGVQALTDHSPVGSVIAERARAAQATGLARTGERLADRVHPSAVTPEQAGTGVRDAVHGKIREFDAEADAAYGRLREIADEHTETVTPKTPAAPVLDAPESFTGKTTPLPDAVFEKAWQEAKKSGFKGSRTELKRKFDDKLSAGLSAYEDMAAVQAETGSVALLRTIRKLGGLKPFTKDFYGNKLRGDFAAISEGFGAGSTWGQKGGASIFRNEGLGIDDMVDQLRQDPKWRSMIESDTDLLDALDDIARQGPPGAQKPNIERALALMDVKPGARWWEETAEPVAMALPVDLRAVRPELDGLYQTLKREAELVPLTGAKAKALTAIDRLMNGPDFAPLDTVDRVLSELKSMARGKDSHQLPELRTQGQGASARAVRHLDAVVQDTVARAGPEAVEMLAKGRQATRAKHLAAEVYDAIRREPVKAFSQAVAAKDSAILQLREVAKLAPAELPKLGRAFLDGLLEKATAEGGFNHSAKLYADWQRVGPDTKRMLFKDPEYVRELDRFFLLAKKLAESPNPSGTALTLQSGSYLGAAYVNPGVGVPAILFSGALSKLLHSPAGVKLLTKGMRIPASSKAATTAYLAELTKATSEAGMLRPASAKDENPERK